MYDIDNFKDTISDGFSFYGIKPADNAISDYIKYFELLIEWNQRTNLVSKNDLPRFAEYHILDSLKVCSFINFYNIKSILDLGSGAGIPGVPISIAFPHIETFLVDSRKKRCNFLNEIKKNFPYLNINVINSKAESMPESFNGYFDIVISRAVYDFKKFYLVSKRFLNDNGALVSIKGDNINNELSDIENILDNNVFNINIYVPVKFKNVRQGNIAVFSKKSFQQL
jgi:16S rRNA (guanine527-N7)-methyltransferase